MYIYSGSFELQTFHNIHPCKMRNVIDYGLPRIVLINRISTFRFYEL